ncbi:MAG: hypothetical protein AB8H79_13830 [Myxococcota bacterium]
MRALALTLLLTACAGEIGIGEIDSDSELPDVADFDGATLRIVSPDSGDFLPWGEVHEFVAELRQPDGALIEADLDVVWDSSEDTEWAPTGLIFDDGSIDVGTHALTAQVELPNGDRLAHTVGGVLVQAEEAGTYVGTFSASTSFQNIPVACAGASILVVDPYGTVVDGTADCVTKLGDFEIPLDFTIEADHEKGAVEGTASAQVISFPVDFPTEGTLEGETLDLGFDGDLLGNSFSGSVSAKRISRDTGQ